jgi:hypothetical protein
LKLNFGAPTEMDGWHNAEDLTRCEHDEAIKWGDVEAVYVGHVLQQIPMTQVVPALEKLWKLLPEATPILVVGPDVGRALVFELHVQQAAKAGAWECTQRLIGMALLDAGFHDCKPVWVENIDGEQWPVGEREEWYTAVSALS